MHNARRTFFGSDSNASTNGFGKGLFTDTNGNSYVTGYFDGTNAFGTNQLGSYGNTDIFVAKYDKDGVLIWARHAGTANNEEGLGITADSAGNCFVTGWYNNATANFGTTNLNTFGGQDIFVAKYDNAGVLQWAVRAGANANDNGLGIATDNLGNCYVTGHYAGNANFSGTTLTNGGGFDLFVAKYSGAGALQWVRRAGGSGSDRGEGIGVDSQGNCYVVGLFSSSVSFDGIIVTTAGGDDFFLAKYDTSGTIQWVRREGGSGNDQGKEVAVDAAGNSFVTGVFNGNATFGTNILTSAGSNDVLVAKYDTSGTLLWIRQAGGAGNEDDFDGAIKVDGNGNCYVTGAYLTNATFGGVTLTNAGDHDIFVAKYDGDGTFQWVQRAGGTSYDYCRQVGVDSSGNVYLTGTFTSNATFAPFTVTSAGASDLFVAKLAPQTLPFITAPPTIQAAAAGSNAAFTVTATGPGLLTYQWFKDGVLLTNSPHLNGVVSASLNLIGMQWTDLGNYLAVVSNAYGAVTSSVAALVFTPPPFAWVRQGHSTAASFGVAIFTDSSGNSYITGDFDGTVILGSFILTSAFTSDIFVAKYDGAGNVIWARRAGGTAGVNQGTAITVDNAGNCFITGAFVGTATFGSINLTSAGGQDTFVAKYDTNGVVQWAVRSGGSAGTDNGYGVVTDDAGNCYVTGEYTGNATFNGVTLTNAGSLDVFLAKYNSAGALQWLRRAGGSGADAGRGLRNDTSGNLYVAGYFGSAVANFDGITITNGGHGANDLFLAKYNSNGIVQWARRGAGSTGGNRTAVAVDAAGNSFVTGIFNGTDTFETNMLVSAGSNDVLITKYDTTGALLWVRQAGGPGNDDDFSGGVAVDAAGNCYVTGAHQLTAYFGSVTLTNAGDHDIFVAKYDGNGTLQFVQRAGGAGYDYSRSIGVDGSGNVYLPGRFSLTSTFAPIAVTAPRPNDLFVAKLAPLNLTTTLQLAIAQTNHSVSLSIFAAPGQSVLIDRAASLLAPTIWANWTNLILRVSPYTISDQDTTNQPQRFYRGRLP